MLGNDSLGQFSLSEIDPPVTYTLSTAVGALTLSGLGQLAAVVQPQTVVTLRAIGLSAELLWLHGGTDGANRHKRRGHARVRLLPRKITVTDRDGQPRQVGYLDRFSAPPPLADVPGWALPEPERGEQRIGPAPLPLLPPDFTRPAPLPHMTALRDLQDESDLLDVLARQPDPLVEDITALLVALQAAGAPDRRAQ